MGCAMSAVSRAFGAIVSAPIVVYQRFISPAFGPRCRYAPSCSTYALQAIRVHGPIKGFILGAWRLLRCNPWSLGGVDHVPRRGRWKPDPWVPPEDWAGHDNWVRPAPMGLDPIDDDRGTDQGLGPLRNNETAAQKRHGKSE